MFVYTWFIYGPLWFPGATLQILRKITIDTAVVNKTIFSEMIYCLFGFSSNSEKEKFEINSFVLLFPFRLLCPFQCVCVYMAGFLEIKKCILPSSWYNCWDLTYLFSTNTEVTALMRKLRVWYFLSSLRLFVVWNGDVGSFRKAFCHDFCPGLRWGLALRWFWVYLLYFLPTKLLTGSIKFAWQRRVLFRDWSMPVQGASEHFLRVQQFSIIIKDLVV